MVITSNGENSVSALISQLEEILIKERRALLESPGKNLDQLSEVKNTLLDNLTQVTSKAGWRKTKENVEAINRCHLMNLENAQLVNQRLKSTRQSLEIVRHHLGDGAVSLYDTTGKIEQRVVTRQRIKV